MIIEFLIYLIQNSIINEFIKSGLLFNENISVNTLINIESTKKR